MDKDGTYEEDKDSGRNVYSPCDDYCGQLKK